MAAHAAVTRARYSMRLVRPFLQLLRRGSTIPPGVLDELAAHDSDERVPADTMHELLAGAVALTNDPTLGLKAARELGLGELGALEYAAGSARTARESLDVIGRYMHLLNDGLDVVIGDEGDRVVVRMNNSVVFPRAAEDFALGAFSVPVKARMREVAGPYEVHFQHRGSDDAEELNEYIVTFPGAKICFGSAFTGFVLDRAHLSRELPTQDAQLHSVLRSHADQLLAALPKVETATSRVRARLLEELRSGEPSAARVAKALGMSSRTLARRLEEEGTSLKALLDDTRRSLALSYTKDSELLLADIALLLGFSHAAAFNRAFKRWTGVTPIDFRRGHRRL